MTPFPAWIAGPFGEIALVLMLACVVCWCLMGRKARR
jgi:hypothetical protein